MDPSEPCPCGSRRPYTGCCLPLHEGAPAPTALELMRSRFSAYALGLADHVIRTWDPETRPAGLDLDDGVVWRRLQIVDTARGGEGDEEGVVEFRASYRTAEGAGILHERSRFRRHEGRWVYVDGDTSGN
ncbi:YchJ family protein [Naasia sp. SYSU D00948]|uniref:YchJ family protein n=1 Tax=Naasia sp. SYSU D00948 TaxID=2817379 RepID=UPI001B30D80C|nr:YchJ family metal-binding protein [Naasia sp. SYSU D00948]